MAARSRGESAGSEDIFPTLSEAEGRLVMKSPLQCSVLQLTIGSESTAAPCKCVARIWLEGKET